MLLFVKRKKPKTKKIRVKITVLTESGCKLNVFNHSFKGG